MLYYEGIEPYLNNDYVPHKILCFILKKLYILFINFFHSEKFRLLNQNNVTKFISYKNA